MAKRDGRDGGIAGRVALAVALALWACGGGGGADEGGGDPGNDRDVPVTPDTTPPDGTPDPGPGDDAANDVDGVGEDADVPPDAAADAADAADATADAWPELPPLEVPFLPPAPADPVKDSPYVQEFNHTTNEVDPALVPLVAVALRPAGFPGEGPVQVTPRGMAWQKGADGWTFRGPADGEADVTMAAAGLGVVAMAGPGVLYRVGPDGAVAKDAAPDGVTVTGLATLDGVAWILTDAGAARLPATGAVLWPTGGVPVSAVARTPDGLLLQGHPDGTVTFHELPAEGLPGPEVATLDASSGLPGGAVRGLVTGVMLPRTLDLVVVADQGVAGLDLLQGGGKVAEPVDVPLFAADRVPLDGPRSAARTWDGGFVVATSTGAYRIVDRDAGPEWHVYGAERWMPAEDLRALATDPEVDLAPLYFATSGGLGWVESRRITLEQKMAPFVDRIVQRHDRDGAVADSHLPRRGDLSSNIPWDSDNDGSWTAYWLMSECARWKVTGADDAKAHFDKSLDAMLFLRTVNAPNDWFLARSVIRKEGCILDDCDDPDDGKWYTSADGKWWIKRDTSNDELIAHFSMMAMAWQWCADADQRTRIGAHLAGILDGLIAHGYQLWDPVTMAVTTYGQLDPEYVNEWIAGRWGDGGLRASILLSGLQMAWLTTGEQRFADARRWLIEEHGYAEAARTEILHDARPLSMDNDEMSSWAWWTNLHFETDPWLREKWVEGFSGVYDTKLKQQQAALWGLVRASTGFADMDVARDVRGWLRRVPVDMIRWNVRNSHRKDVVGILRPFDPAGGGYRSDGRPIPYDERRNDRFNTDQYRLDGGMDGTVEMDGAEVLLTYWMSRLFGFIAPE